MYEIEGFIAFLQVCSVGNCAQSLKGVHDSLKKAKARMRITNTYALQEKERVEGKALYSRKLILI